MFLNIKLKKQFYIPAIVVIFIFITVFLLIRHQSNLTYAEYDIYSPKIKNEIKAVVLADLHGKEYGKNNERLIEDISSKQPDVIFMVGDMITSEDELIKHESFLKNLVKIAPVYYSFGNKEIEILKKHDIRPRILATGINLIEDEIKEMEINNNKISVYGVSSFIFTEQSFKEKFSRSIFEEYSNSGEFKLLLCHYPEYYIWFFKNNDTFKYDLMLSGHTHGGLVNLPIFGRIYAPNQQKPAECIYGSYPFFKNGPMIISGGLGNPDKGFRINNPPEITVINIKPADF